MLSWTGQCRLLERRSHLYRLLGNATPDLTALRGAKSQGSWVVLVSWVSKHSHALSCRFPNFSHSQAAQEVHTPLLPPSRLGDVAEQCDQTARSGVAERTATLLPGRDRLRRRPGGAELRDAG